MATPKKSQEVEKQQEGVGLDQNISQMIAGYDAAQKAIKADLDKLNKSGNMNPGAYLEMQTKMSKLSQIGESISQYIATLQVMIKNMIGKFRPM